MSAALYVPVKESLSELRKELKKATLMSQPRIKMLIAMKNAEEDGISKRELMAQIGVSGQSIQTWRSNYQKGGLKLLISHNRKGFKPSTFDKNEHEKISLLLHDPHNGLQGYKELQQWIKKEFKKEVKYNTLLKYCILHFKSRSKVARKSHIKKDDGAVEHFKKTSVVSAAKSSQKRKKITQK